MFCNVDPGNRICYSHERIQPCVYGLAGSDLPPNQPFGLTQNLPVGDLAVQRSLSDQGFDGLPIGKCNSLMIPPYKVSRTPSCDVAAAYGCLRRRRSVNERNRGWDQGLLSGCYGDLPLSLLPDAELGRVGVAPRSFLTTRVCVGICHSGQMFDELDGSRRWF